MINEKTNLNRDQATGNRKHLLLVAKKFFYLKFQLQSPVIPQKLKLI